MEKRKNSSLLGREWWAETREFNCPRILPKIKPKKINKTPQNLVDKTAKIK